MTNRRCSELSEDDVRNAIERCGAAGATINDIKVKLGRPGMSVQSLSPILVNLANAGQVRRAVFDHVTVYELVR